MSTPRQPRLSPTDRRARARSLALRHLALRQAAAHDPTWIAGVLAWPENGSHDFSPEEVRDACVSLVTMGFAVEVPDAMGGDSFYQATEKGVAHHVRNPVPVQ